MVGGCIGKPGRHHTERRRKVQGTEEGNWKDWNRGRATVICLRAEDDVLQEAKLISYMRWWQGCHGGAEAPHRPQRMHRYAIMTHSIRVNHKNDAGERIHGVWIRRRLMRWLSFRYAVTRHAFARKVASKGKGTATTSRALIASDAVCRGSKFVSEVNGETHQSVRKRGRVWTRQKSARNAGAQQG